MSENSLSIVSCLIQLEKITQQLCKHVYEQSENEGLRKLIYSVMNQDREHEEQLIRYEHEFGAKDLRMEKTDTDCLPLPANEEDIPDSLNEKDFMQLLIEWKDKLIELYGLAVKKDEALERRAFFSRAGHDEQKHRSWVQDRLDLETL